MDERANRIFVVVLLALALLAAGCAKEPETLEATEPSVESEVKESTSPNEAEGSENTAPACRGSGPAGRATGRPLAIDLATQGGVTYRTTSFRPAFSFEALSMPYPFIAEMDTPCGLSMHSGERGGLFFIRVSSVVDPESGEFVEAPRNLVSWVKQHPNVRVTAMRKVSVDGFGGTQFDVVLKGQAANPPPECPPCIPLVPLGEGEMFGAPARLVSLRWTILDVEGTTVLISVEAERGIRALARDADKLLASLRFATH